MGVPPDQRLDGLRAHRLHLHERARAGSHHEVQEAAPPSELDAGELGRR